MKRFLKRLAFGVALCLGLFGLSVWILGNIIVNGSFEHTDDGIEIIMVSNGVHVDIVVPLENEMFNWKKHLQANHFSEWNERLDHCMFGWGNRQFYLQTPTWNDLKLRTVAIAFMGLGETVIHADLCTNSGWDDTSSRRIRLSDNQYTRLCDYLLSTFKKNKDGVIVPIPNKHYHRDDAFYEANGHYHLFRTCNVWAGEAMSKSGVRVGYWTLTPGQLLQSLPKSYLR